MREWVLMLKFTFYMHSIILSTQLSEEPTFRNSISIALKRNLRQSRIIKCVTAVAEPHCVGKMELVNGKRSYCAWCALDNKLKCIPELSINTSFSADCVRKEKKTRKRKSVVYSVHIDSGLCESADHSSCAVTSENGVNCLWCEFSSQHSRSTGKCMNFSMYTVRENLCISSHKLEQYQFPNRISWDYEISHCLQKYKADKLTISKLPSSEINDHYLDILKKTEIWRTCPYYNYQFVGPRIENFWISEFMRRIETTNNDLSTVFPGGVVPLFIKWQDCVMKDSNFTIFINETLKTILRHDVLYVTVSQSAQGIYRTKGFNYMPKNLLLFNCAGYGHIPLPLFNLELPFSNKLCGGLNEPVCVHYSSFVGRLTTGPMRKSEFFSATMKARKSSSDIKIFSNFIPNWESIMENSLTSLAPRGHGRTSFRLFESLQKGVIPIYVFDDFEWLPYKGTHADLNRFGFSVQISNLTEALVQIRSILTPEEVTRRRNVMRALRMTHYSYAGMLNQIGLYLKYGASVSDLRCNTIPNSAT